MGFSEGIHALQWIYVIPAMPFHTAVDTIQAVKINTTLISTIFSIMLVVFGGACVMLFVSTKTLRDSRDDQEKRIDQLEAERLRDKEQISEQATAIKFWRSAATGDEKLDNLSVLITGMVELLTEHHTEARANWVLVTSALGHLGVTNDRMSESLERLVALGEGRES